MDREKTRIWSRDHGKDSNYVEGSQKMLISQKDRSKSEFCERATEKSGNFDIGSQEYEFRLKVAEKTKILTKR